MTHRLVSSLLAYLSENRLLVTLVIAGIGEQAALTAARVATSYRAVELNLDIALIGLITASFALVPIFIAVKVGRYVDLGNDVRISRIGSLFVILCCAGLALSTNWYGLLAFTILLGIAHTSLYIGLQTLSASDDRPGMLERVVGALMVANAIGQGIGSGVVSWFGGSADIPPSQQICACAAVIACTCFAATLMMPQQAGSAKRALAEKPAVPMITILKVPGFIALVLVSVIAVLSGDLMVVYLPLLGIERSISAGDIGAMIGLRAVASAVARVGFAKLHRMFGGNTLLAFSTFAGAIGFLAFTLPLPIWAMYIAVAVSGFALSLATTVSIAGTMALMTPATRGTAASLRMLGNRVAQFTLPFGLSLIAAVTGFAAIFGMIGAGLMASAAAAHWRRPAAR